MKPFFITAIGTNVGKTLLTCALVHQLRQKNQTVCAIKPVISGFDENNISQSDTGQLLRAQNKMITKDIIDAISPWRFKAPLSPDMAAEDEGETIDFDQVIAFCKKPRDADYLLVEGVGGVMVPLDSSHTVLDWMMALEFPVILVAGTYLGALSHTLTAVRAILSAGLTLGAIVISESENSSVPMVRMQYTLAHFIPSHIPLLSIARLDSSPELWKNVANLTESIFSCSYPEKQLIL